MAIDYDNLNYLSTVPVDKIFQYLTGSVSVSNANPNPASVYVDVNMNPTLSNGSLAYCYFDGVYTVDNGTTQYGFSEKKGSAKFGSGFIVSPLIRFNSTSVRVQLDASIPSTIPYPDALTHTVNYKVVLFDSNESTGLVTPIIPNSITKYFDSAERYQVVHLMGSAQMFLSSTPIPNVVVTHNLGYRPVVKAFIKRVSQSIVGDMVVVSPEFEFIDIIIDTTNVTFSLDTDSWSTYNGALSYQAQLEYRIYRR